MYPCGFTTLWLLEIFQSAETWVVVANKVILRVEIRLWKWWCRREDGAIHLKKESSRRQVWPLALVIKLLIKKFHFVDMSRALVGLIWLALKNGKYTAVGVHVEFRSFHFTEWEERKMGSYLHFSAGRMILKQFQLHGRPNTIFFCCRLCKTPSCFQSGLEVHKSSVCL